MTRATRNAAMVRTYGRDSWSQTPPQSEAMRQHVHGRLQPLDMDGRPVIKGEIQGLLPWITLASASVVIAIVWSLT